MANKWAGAALVGLVVVDVGLVGFALHRQGQVPADASTTTGATSSSTPGSTNSTGARATSGSTGSSSASGSSGGSDSNRLIVAAVTSQTFWRATSPAKCTQASEAKLQLTTDGGKTWTTVSTGAHSISALSASNSGVNATGADSSCATKHWWLTTTGANSTTSRPQWSIDPKDETKVVAQGNSSTPCTSGTVTDLATSDASNATVLCSNGSVRSTTSGGQSWSNAGSVKGALAIASNNGQVYAVTTSSCGLNVAPVSGASATGAQCLDGSSGQAGPADMTAYGNQLVLVAGDKTWVGNTGNLTSWNVVSPSS